MFCDKVHLTFDYLFVFSRGMSSSTRANQWNRRGVKPLGSQLHNQQCTSHTCGKYVWNGIQIYPSINSPFSLATVIPHAAIDVKTGAKLFPKGVIAYSTFNGGFFVYTFPVINPSFSN